MDTKFRGVLPFKTYRVLFQGGREDILAALDHCLTPAPWTRYNFIFVLFARPRQMFGTIVDDSVHITGRGVGRNGGQVLLHGRIVAEDENGCVLQYRLIPNYYVLLFALITLIFGARILLTARNDQIWMGLFPLLPPLFCWMLSVVSSTHLNMCMNDVLNQYLEA